MALVVLGTAFLSGVVLALIWVLSRRAALLCKGATARHKEPGVFTGREEQFCEWLFTMDEAIRSYRPDDPVAFAASYLDGNARRWFIVLCSKHQRPASWDSFRRLLKDTFRFLL